MVAKEGRKVGQRVCSRVCKIFDKVGRYNLKCKYSVQLKTAHGVDNCGEVLYERKPGSTTLPNYAGKHNDCGTKDGEKRYRCNYDGGLLQTDTVSC
ncbi:hypothetical protein BH11BAC5_BH11BAC5_09600 [soil metagenome]